MRYLGNDVGERRLTCAGRSGENYGRQTVRFDGAPQELAGRENVFLSDEFIEGSRPHSCGQRCGGSDFRIFADCFFEKILHGKSYDRSRLSAYEFQQATRHTG